MEEIYQITSALKFLEFGKHVAVLTDARFSGVSTGACIGHVGPEALAGGPIGRVLAGDRIQIEIWERGAGYTLASGSSSCAAAAASVKRGLCSGDVTVMMPGGSLEIGVSDDFALTMRGPASKVAHGTIADDVLNDVD